MLWKLFTQDFEGFVEPEDRSHVTTWLQGVPLYIFVQHIVLDEIKQAEIGDSKVDMIKTNISKGKASGFL